MDDAKVYEAMARLDRYDESLKEVKADIKDLYGKTALLTELSISIRTLAENLKDVKDTVVEIKKDQDEVKDEIVQLKHAPNSSKAKMFDRAVIAVLSALGGGLIMYILKVALPQIFA